MSSPGSTDPPSQPPAVDASVTRLRYGWSKAPVLPKSQHNFVPPGSISVNKATVKREQLEECELLDKEIDEKKLDVDRIRQERDTVLSVANDESSQDAKTLPMQTQPTSSSEEDVDLEEAPAVEQAPMPSTEDEDDQAPGAPEQKKKAGRCLLFLIPLVVLAIVAIPLGAMFGRKSEKLAPSPKGLFATDGGENGTDVPSAAPSQNMPSNLVRPNWPLDEESWKEQSVLATLDPTPSPTNEPPTKTLSKSPSLSPSTAPPSKTPSVSPITKVPSLRPTTNRPTTDQPTTPAPTLAPQPCPFFNKWVDNSCHADCLVASALADQHARPIPLLSSSYATLNECCIAEYTWEGAYERCMGITSPPTSKPTQEPSAAPITKSPSKTPSLSPSMAPPSKLPSASPSTKHPSKSPSFSPSTAARSKLPSAAPTTKSPSKTPSLSPSTAAPIKSPSASPLTKPSKGPSVSPSTATPIKSPSTSPITKSPSKSPSLSPSTAPPSKSPSASPSTKSPSKSPSHRPTTTRPTTAQPTFPSDPPKTKEDIEDEFNEELSKRVFGIEDATFTAPGIPKGTLSGGRCYDLFLRNLTVYESKSTVGHGMGLRFSDVSLTCTFDWEAEGKVLWVVPVYASGDLTTYLEDTSFIDLDVVYTIDPFTNQPDAVDVTNCKGNVDFDIDLHVDGWGSVFEDFGWISEFLDDAKNFLFDVIGGPLLRLLCDVFEEGKVSLLNDILIHNYPTLAKLAAQGSALFGE